MKLRADHWPNVIQIMCNRVRILMRVELSMPTEQVPTSLPQLAPLLFPLLLQYGKATQKNKNSSLRSAVGYLPLLKIHHIHQHIKSPIVKNSFLCLNSSHFYPFCPSFPLFYLIYLYNSYFHMSVNSKL